MPKVNVPTYDALMNPLIQALKGLGGSGTVEEITNKVAEIVGLTDEQLELIHDPDKGGMTEVEYRLAWSRTWLKRYGLLENSSRGVWALTAKGNKIDRIDEKEVVKTVRAQLKKEREDTAHDEESTVETTWRDDLLETLPRCQPRPLQDSFNGCYASRALRKLKLPAEAEMAGLTGKG